MKTRTSKLIAIIAMAAFTLSSCSSELEMTTGEYQFKTSGSVTLTEGSNTKTYILDDEVGELDIVSNPDVKDGVVITMNGSFGPVQATTGRITGNRIEVDDFTRTLSFKEISSHIIQDDLVNYINFADVKVEGKGERYGDMLLFTWTYTGTSTDGKYTLSGKEIKTVAKQNK